MGMLAIAQSQQHSFLTCGQSRGGGLVTSDGERRSNVFGRVAVAYVQGSPKGGGALGSLGVTSTRLAPAPSNEKEVPMPITGSMAASTIDQFKSCQSRATSRAYHSMTIKGFSVALATLAMASPSLASAQTRANEDILRRIDTSITVAPDAACKIPQTDIERWLIEHSNDYGLMDNIATTVFGTNLTNAPAKSGYQALLEQTREETTRRSARTKATFEALRTGQAAPVGQGPVAAPPNYSAYLTDVQAISRIEGGLNCEANVRVDQLRFPMTYTLTLDPNQSDGWASQPQLPVLSEAEALAEQSLIRIFYDGSELTLAQARQQSQLNAAERNALAEKARQRRLSEEAYRNSPAGKASAAAKTMALSAEYKRRGLACQNSGGTWGFRWDNRTIAEVTPGVVPSELIRFSLACYHL